MKYLSSILQVVGASVLVAGVASFNLLLGVILGGAFLIIFGIALEIRGK
jgi:predicted outer membrane lipoprotein